jgi:hypothetical protein
MRGLSLLRPGREKVLTPCALTLVLTRHDIGLKGGNGYTLRQPKSGSSASKLMIQHRNASGVYLSMFAPSSLFEISSASHHHPAS